MDLTKHRGVYLSEHQHSLPEVWGVSSVMIPACKAELVELGVLPYTMGWVVTRSDKDVDCEECKAILVEACIG